VGAVVVLARYATVAQAELARSALDAAGIDAAIGDEELVTMNWLYSNAVGGVKLLVAEEDAERAAEVLSSEADVESGGHAAAVESDGESGGMAAALQKCPGCGGTEYTRIPKLRLFLFATILLWGLGVAIDQRELAAGAIGVAALILLVTPSATCNACGERFRAAAEPKPEAPPPADFDTIEQPCPRCGSLEYYRIDYRRLKSLPMLFEFAIFVVVPIWLFLPSKRCDACGYRGR
jgi:predicted RNA-binding Zn-ribbon protein involved in translation (DUF1610 family)